MHKTECTPPIDRVRTSRQSHVVHCNARCLPSSVLEPGCACCGQICCWQAPSSIPADVLHGESNKGPPTEAAQFCTCHCSHVKPTLQVVARMLDFTCTHTFTNVCHIRSQTCSPCGQVVNQVHAALTKWMNLKPVHMACKILNVHSLHCG